MTKAFLLALLLSLLAGGLALPPRSGLAAGDAITQVLALKDASLILEVDGKVRIAHLADQPMIPASTMKVVTALAAIQRWGSGSSFPYGCFYPGRLALGYGWRSLSGLGGAGSLGGGPEEPGPAFGGGDRAG